MTRPLNGKSALVTGGTRGIGYAIAQRLMADGAAVTVTGTKPDGAGPEGTAYHAADFSDPADTQACVDWVAGAGFDILVNNAGVNKIAPFAEIDPEDFARLHQINVTAPFLLCRAAIPAMRDRGWGRIVNISSLWGKIAKEQRAAYGATKFGLDGLTAHMAAEVARDGIIANCVAPGFIETDMTRTFLGPQGMVELAAQVPVRRLGQPEEIAALVAWLAGVENTYVSGQNIAIDGGFTRV